MIFHIAVCSPDPVLRGRVERQCLEYYARRADACIVEQLPGVDALLARDAEGTRYELYLVELTAGNAPAGLKAADTLRRHGARAPLAFFAHTQINPATIVQNKLQMFRYYKDLYTRLGMYEEVRPQLYKFLVDIAESTYPSGPFKKAIDEAKAYWRAHKQ